MHQIIDRLLEFRHPTYSYFGKLDLTSNLAARKLFEIYFRSTHFHVFAYVGLDAVAEISLTIYVACSPRANFVRFMWIITQVVKYSRPCNIMVIQCLQGCCSWLAYVIILSIIPACAQLRTLPLKGS